MKSVTLVTITLLLLCGLAGAQTNTFCSSASNCNYTGNNTHNGTENFFKLPWVGGKPFLLTPVTAWPFNALCDGLHDDTTAIQTAINTQGDNGGILLPAVCATSATLTITNNGFTVAGLGGNTGLVLLAGHTGDAIHAGGTAGAFVNNRYNFHDFSITGVTGSNDGLSIVYAGKADISNVVISSMGHDCLHTFQTTGVIGRNLRGGFCANGWGAGQQSDSSECIGCVFSNITYFPYIWGESGSPNTSYNGPKISGDVSSNGTCAGTNAACNNAVLPTATVALSGGVPIVTVTGGGTNLNATIPPLAIFSGGSSCSDGKQTVTLAGGVVTAVTSTVTGCTVAPRISFSYGGGALINGANNNGCEWSVYAENNYNSELQLGLPSDVTSGGPVGCDVHGSYSHSTAAGRAPVAILDYLQNGKLTVRNSNFEGATMTTAVQQLGSAGTYGPIEWSGNNAFGMNAITDPAGNAYNISQSTAGITVHIPGTSTVATDIYQCPAGSAVSHAAFYNKAPGTTKTTWIDCDGNINTVGTTVLANTTINNLTLNGTCTGTGCITGTASPAVVRGDCTGTATANTTIYLHNLGGVLGACTNTASTNGSAFYANRVGILKDLHMIANTGGVNASSGACTVFDGGTATPLTCTFGTGTTCVDSTHTYSIAIDRQVILKCTTQVGETLNNIGASLTFQ